MAKEPTATRKRSPRKTILVVPSWQLLGENGSRLGANHLELLRQIHAQGSLRLAATHCGVAYRTAWSRVSELNSLAGEPLVLSINGGASGGESTLSEAGRRLLDIHERAHVLFQAAMDRGGIDPVKAGSWAAFLRRISMKTSARNQLWGRVSQIRKGTVHADVEITTPGGVAIVAQITMRSIASLGLVPGSEVWALVKASAVAIATGPEPTISADNRLSGTVVGIVRSKLNTEVEISIHGDDRIVATCSLQALDELGIQRGGKAWAFFNASSVIIGTLG